MPTDLITLPDKSTVMLPVARNPGAEQLRANGLIERLPEWLPDERLAKRFVMAVAAEVNRLDADVNPVSIIRTAFNCAVLGLLPGQQLGHAHFIPYGKECQLVIGYKGFLELAYRCGFLKDVQCEVVLRGEEYKRWNEVGDDGGGAHIIHTLPLGREEEWANVEGAYCIWNAMTGGHGIEVVGRKKLEPLYKKAKSKSAWKTEPIEMAKKTPLRRAAKRWNLTNEMAKAVWLDEAAERGEVQPYVGDKPMDDSDAPTPTLAQFETPSESAADADPDPKALAKGYELRLRDARLPVALDHAYEEYHSDGNLLEDDVAALDAVYEECGATLAEPDGEPR
jgi:recombination protein RecT